MWYLLATEIPPAGAPSGGRGSLCGNVWLSRSPLHPVCRFAQDDTWVTGARYLICLVQMLAPSARPHPSLRATFPLEGEGYYARCDALGGASQQRRSRLLAPRQGGGVRLRGNVWLSRSPLHPVCRFAQDDTWVGWNVVRNLFGVRLFVALCGTS